MINASREFKEKLKNGASIANYADITLIDGTLLHLEPKDFMISGCRIDDKTTDGKFGVGYTIGKTLSIKIANYKDQYSKYDFFNSIITLYVAMLLDDGTIEKIRKGKYYATIPQTPGDIIEITAVDNMYKLDRPYNASTVYPATLQTILSDCCVDCGIPIRFRQFDNYNFVINQKPEGVTYRQVVSYACQAAGYNARIDNDGYMDLVWYSSQALDTPGIDGGNYKHQEEFIINGGNFSDYGAEQIFSGGLFTDESPENVYRIKTLTVHTDDVVITGVKVIFEDTEVLFGEEGYVVQLKDNPFTQGKEQEIANYLGARVVGMVFRPFTAQILNNPLYEPFDVVRLYDRKGNMYLSIINSISYTIGSYTTISCEAEDPVRNGSQYFSAAAQAVAEARRNTKKQLSTYDKVVQNMNQIAMNAMGFHTTYEEQEDGSRVVYLHDKPNLSDSQIIYKQTIDGFFLSQDGGESYTAGFDSNGNAVLNILYAIGIVADWIHSGTLTLGGNENGNGILNVLNSNGELIGRWDKDGISSTKGSFTGDVNATTLNSANAHITGGKIDIRSDSQTQSVLEFNAKEGDKSTWLSANAYSVSVSNGVKNQDSETIYNSTSIGSSYIAMSREDVSGWAFYVGGNIKEMRVGMDAFFFKRMICEGTKSRVVKSDNFGKILQYCYETPSPMFGDIGCGKLDENGLCYVYFDLIFFETVSTDRTYQVFLQKEGQGDLWIEEKKEEYFLAKGSPGLLFSWEVKVKQKDYEYERLDTFEENKGETEIDYEKESIEYLDQYEKEILEYEKIN